MAEFQTKKDNKKIWHSPLMLFVLLSVLLIFMYNMVGLVEKARDTSKKREIVLKQIESLNIRESALKSNIDKLNTDTGKEETLRDKYHLVKEGEKMVVIVDQEANAGNIIPKEEPKKGFLQFFNNLFR